MTIKIEQNANSRFVTTRLLQRQGVAFWGIWKPLSIELDGTEQQYTVQRGQEGQLDLIADAVYGDRALWYVIAQANGIDLPMEQVVAGVTLVIPRPDAVRAALRQRQNILTRN